MVEPRRKESESISMETAKGAEQLMQKPINTAPKDRIIEISDDGERWIVTRWLTTRQRRKGSIVWTPISYWTKGCFPGDREQIDFMPTLWRELRMR